MKERRQETRYKIDVPVSFQVKGHSQEEFANSHDLSLGGTRLITERALPVDRDIYLVIEFPDTEFKLRARGRIIWGREVKSSDSHDHYFETGVNFNVMNESDSQKLYDYLHKISGMSLLNLEGERFN